MKTIISFCFIWMFFVPECKAQETDSLKKAPMDTGMISSAPSDSVYYILALHNKKNDRCVHVFLPGEKITYMDENTDYISMLQEVSPDGYILIRTMYGNSDTVYFKELRSLTFHHRESKIVGAFLFPAALTGLIWTVWARNSISQSTTINYPANLYTNVFLGLLSVSSVIMQFVSIQMIAFPNEIKLHPNFLLKALPIHVSDDVITLVR
jgi:hypothetical protein